MDFSTDLHYRLYSLDAALARATSVMPGLPTRWLPRGRRLFARKRHRVALVRWRALRDSLLSAGVPPLYARLGVMDGPPSFFWHGTSGARIWLPVHGNCVPPLSERASEVPYSQAILLLHEWGHALLHPQSDHSWLEWLSGPAREHAHPAWAQVGEYAGWRVFNEMFADAFAAAWMLRLFNRSTHVVDALRCLRRVRQHTEKNFNHVDFPCHHQTSQVIDWVMKEEWSGDAREIVPRLVALCSSAFSAWYEGSTIPGRAVCASSMDHITMLDREFSGSRTSVSMRGRSWRALGQPSNPYSRALLAMLHAEQPDHFLWGLRAVSGVMNFPSANQGSFQEPVLTSR